MITKINLKKDDMILINGVLSISVVQGCSALPIVYGNALKISGNIDSSPIGYSTGNSGYRYKVFQNKAVYVQPGVQIPHESQLPRCFLVADGAMFWRTSLVTHQNKVYEEEENAMYWKHGEIVFNNETGESTFHKINDAVLRLWKEVSYPLLQKQLNEIEIERRTRETSPG